MFEFLTDASYWREVYVYAFTFHQIGYNMIPVAGWEQAITAWAADKVKS